MKAVRRHCRAVVATCGERRQLCDDGTDQPSTPATRHGCLAGCFGGPACVRRGSAWRLATLLFGSGDRHVTAEMLHEEAVQRGRARVAGHGLQHAASIQAGGPAARDRHRRRSAPISTPTRRTTITSSSRPRASWWTSRAISIRVDGLPEPPETEDLAHRRGRAAGAQVVADLPRNCAAFGAAHLMISLSVDVPRACFCSM